MRFLCAIALAALVGLFAIAASPGNSEAQLVREHDATSLRGFHGSAGTRIRRSFQSDAEARNVLRYILTAAGLAGLEDRIILRASADTPNAEAYIDKNKDNQDERLIFYNAVFMQELQKQTKDYWSLVAVLAHELGHHVRFHTAIPGRDHEFELEADYQAGFILRRLGATLDQAQGAFRSIGGEQATASHPSRAERLQAVTIGWTDGDARHTPPWQTQQSQQPSAPPPAVFKAPAPTAAAPARLSEAAEAWDRTKDTTNIGVLEAFLTRYKDTYYADLARARIDELKKQQVAVAAPPKASTPAPALPPQPVVAVPPAVPARCDGAEALVGNELRCLKPKDSFKDCPECPEMVVVPSGEFIMGSPETEEGRDADEGPQRKVTIAKPFATGKFEVTFAEWDACVAAAAGCKHKPRDQGWGKGTRPVIEVSWDDAKEYVSWLTKKTGRTYRLLSEAEWEYATRAGTATPFSTGRTITTDQANFDGNSTYGGSTKGVNRGKTIEVGSLNKPNPFGLHDMHGNVFEWVEDCYEDNYNGAPTDGSATSSASCSSRVIRGGSWFIDPRFLRSAVRDKYHPIYRSGSFGFRVARTLQLL